MAFWLHDVSSSQLPELRPVKPDWDDHKHIFVIIREVFTSHVNNFEKYDYRHLKERCQIITKPTTYV
ncbi:hypothetical protein HanIR_Chr13g0627041 [Helianthus annuus]|nr:hypothetical protein HanIR_Chr13g0627041 [Helianthus annuus]